MHVRSFFKNLKNKKTPFESLFISINADLSDVSNTDSYLVTIQWSFSQSISNTFFCFHCARVHLFRNIFFLFVYRVNSTNTENLQNLKRNE